MLTRYYKPVLYQNSLTVLDADAALSLFYNVLKRIWVSPEIRVLPFGTLCQTLELEKFRHGTSTVADVFSFV